jgi:ABC-2 type transport system permease protein
VNGFATIGILSNLKSGLAPATIFAEVIQPLLIIGGITTAIGMVTTSQGAIIGEKQLGTGAWIISKPVTRSAFVLAKLVAIGASFLTLAINIPGTIYYAQSVLLAGYTPDPAAYLSALGVLALQNLFYLALSLMLGTLFATRGPVSGIALGCLFGGLLLPKFLPRTITLLTPWPITTLAPALAQGEALPAEAMLPLIASALWTVLFVAVALWRFGREEF